MTVNEIAQEFGVHPYRWIPTVLYNPLMVSAKALSYESPKLPTEGSMPDSVKRRSYRQVQQVHLVANDILSETTRERLRAVSMKIYTG